MRTAFDNKTHQRSELSNLVIPQTPAKYYVFPAKKIIHKTHFLYINQNLLFV